MVVVQENKADVHFTKKYVKVLLNIKKERAEE
jgi:hypothetical protein